MKLDLPDNYLWFDPESGPLDLLQTLFGKVKGSRAYRLMADRLGEEPESLLGVGTQGAAYLLPSGRVLKFTKDDGELWAADFIQSQRGIPGLPTFFDSFTLADRQKRLGIGVLVREYVDLEPPEGYAPLVEFINWAEGQAASGMENTVGELKESMGKLLKILDSQRVPRRFREEVSNFAEGIRTLYDAGYYTMDYSSNFGFQGTQPVLFDVSVNTKTPPRTPVLWL